MLYKIGMLCKHFKGKDLLEKNIYRIISIGNRGCDLTDDITYSGDYDVSVADNLVVYANVFQNNKLFAREYEDISSELSEDKQKLYFQKIKVQPLSDEEIVIINSPDFIEEKLNIVKEKFKTNIKK